MEKKNDILLPETGVHEDEQLKGVFSLKFREDHGFNQFCRENFDQFDPVRFEAIALRVFAGEETVTTLYAVDRFKQDPNESKLPVKKFKSTKLKMQDILPFIDEYNFTVTAGNYSLEQMEVINK